MASSEEDGALVRGDGRTEALDIPPNTHLESPRILEARGISSTPVEMSDLPPHKAPSEDIATFPKASAANPVSEENIVPRENTRPLDEETAPSRDATSIAPISEPQNPHPATEPTREPLNRQKTAPAIGPASDKPMAIEKELETTGPSIIITLLLTNGARHPYKIDGKYLKKRNVNVTGNDPVNMSVYTLKELIYREWREEWEAKPAAPTSIRLIHYGKMLDDKSHLKDGKFENGPTPHVVHMSIKPQEMVDEEDARMAKSGARLERNGSERSPGCRCVIQ